MSLLVQEIFSLPSMENARLLAGQSGLGNLIVSVGIADNCNTQYRDIYQGAPFMKNRLMLSALFSGWSVETQRTCLQFLHRGAASGLMIFQMPDCCHPFDPMIYETADELHIPIIQMEPSRWSYSEVIDLIMGEIHRKNQEHYKLSYSTLMKLASIPQDQHSEDRLLEILSQNAQVSIALLDGDFVLRHQSAHCACAKGLFEAPAFLEQVRNASGEAEPVFQTPGDRCFCYACQRIFLQNSNLKYMVIASDKGIIPPALQDLISDAVSFFFADWGINQHGRNSLAQSILSQSPVESQAIAKSLHIRLEDLSMLYLCFPTQRLPDQEMTLLFMKIEQYFTQLSFRPVMSRFSSYIAIFLEAPGYPIDFADFTAAFQMELESFDSRFFLFAHMQQNIASRDFFPSVIENIQYARKIYPYKKVYTLQELQFVQTCMGIVRQGQEAVNQALEFTKPRAKGQSLTGDLWQTLTVYLLDADGKIETTANYLYIHTSTVKYRLKRINDYLGYNVSKMPESYHLYIALAVTRLTK